MDLLTVKEVAELKGCSQQYIRKLIAESKLKAMENSNPANHAKEYIVPASALPVDLQRKYYGQRKAEVGLPPELKPVKIEKKPSSKAVKKAFEEYTAEEREEIALWCKILKDWQEKRIRYKNKTQADPDFVGYARITYPEVQISVDILYRKYAAYVNLDYEGLVDKRGGWNKGSSAIDETVWLMFTRLYLQGSQEMNYLQIPP